MAVYTDEVLRQNAAVFLRLSFPPYEEGAIYTMRRLRLSALVRQLGLSPLCGHDGDNFLCFVNGNGLTMQQWKMLPLLGLQELRRRADADSMDRGNRYDFLSLFACVCCSLLPQCPCVSVCLCVYLSFNC